MGLSTIGSSIARLKFALIGNTKPAVRNDFVEEQRRAAIGLNEGYARHETPAGPVFTSQVSEASYFAEESEFAPTIMTVEPARLTEANAVHIRRTSRFEDPTEEFINAGPKASKTPIDYSVFNVRVGSVPAPAEDLFSASKPVEVPEAVVNTVAVAEIEPVEEEPEITITPVEDIIRVEPIKVEPVDEPVEEEPVVETVSVETIEVPVVETSVEPIMIEPVVEEPVIEAPTEETVAEVSVPEIITIAPVEEPVIEAVPEEAVSSVPSTPVMVSEPATIETPIEETVEEPVSIGFTEESAAEEEEPVEISPAEEIATSTAVFGGMANCAGVAITSGCLSMQAYVPILDDECELVKVFRPELVDDYMECERSMEDLLPETDDGMERMLAESIEMEEREAALEEQASEAAEVAVEVPSEIAEPSAEAPAEEPAVMAIEAPAPVACLPPASEVKCIEAPAGAPAFEEIPEEPVFGIPSADAPVEDISEAVAPEEPVIEIAPIEEIAETPAEEPVVEIAPTERKSEPSILSRKSVDPADVAAVLFGF